TAYDLYLRAFALFVKFTPESSLEALTLLNKAIEYDPSFSSAHGLIANCHLNLFMQFRGTIEHERALGLEAARQAIETGRENPDALARAGYCIALLGERPQEGLQHLERALALNPNALMISRCAGSVYILVGDHAKALALYERTVRFGSLSPDAWESYLG